MVFELPSVTQCALGRGRPTSFVSSKFTDPQIYRPLLLVYSFNYEVEGTSFIGEIVGGSQLGICIDSFPKARGLWKRNTNSYSEAPIPRVAYFFYSNNNASKRVGKDTVLSVCFAKSCRTAELFLDSTLLACLDSSAGTTFGKP